MAKSPIPPARTPLPHAASGTTSMGAPGFDTVRGAGGPGAPASVPPVEVGTAHSMIVAEQADPVLDASGQYTPGVSLADGAALVAATAADDAATGKGAIPPGTDASGLFTRSADVTGAAAVADDLEGLTSRLSPPAVGPVPRPLPAVQLFGTKGTSAVDNRVAPGDAFDRRSVVEKLLTHPMAEVRQRAAEAQVAIHHGAADVGIKVRAAIDTARGAETRR